MNLALAPAVLARFAVISLFALGACSSDDSSATQNAVDDAGESADSAHSAEPRVPVQHRPSDAACSLPAAAGNCTSQSTANGSCTSDSQCSAGTNGRCLTAAYGVASTTEPACACAYDSCAQDSACDTGETCACHGAPYTSGAASTCVASDCRVDSDCGTGGYCSPSSQEGVCGDSLAAYYCHTAKDECIDDADCLTPEQVDAGGGDLIARCEYSLASTRWACVQVEVCA